MANDTTHGKYVGPLTHLRSHGALLQPSPQGGWLAQFDVPNTFRHGVVLFLYEGWQEDALGFHWHEFAKDDFEIDKDWGKD